jgi:hypothetical protein
MCLPPTDVLWCFQDAAGAYLTTPTLGTGSFAYGSGVTPGANVGGNAGPPECATSGSRAATGSGWSEVDETAAVAAGDCYIFTIATGAGPLTLVFDAHRSNTGPVNWAALVTPSLPAVPVTVGTGVVPTAFSLHPMNAIDLSSVANLSNQAAAEVRICAWGGGATGTFRIDNVRIKGP